MKSDLDELEEDVNKPPEASSIDLRLRAAGGRQLLVRTQPELLVFAVPIHARLDSFRQLSRRYEYHTKERSFGRDTRPKIASEYCQYTN